MLTGRINKVNGEAAVSGEKTRQYCLVLITHDTMVGVLQEVFFFGTFAIC